MAVPIFPNSSYFIAFGGSPVFFEEIRLASLRHQARIYVCRSRTEFVDALKVVRFPSGLFLDGNGLAEKDLLAVVLEVSGRRSCPVCFVSPKARAEFASMGHVRTALVPPDAKSEVWRAAIDEFMGSLVPPRLDQIILDCANTIFPRFFPAFTPFKKAGYAMEDADYVLNFSVSADEVIGQFIVWTKWDEICKMAPDMPSERSGDKILDLLKESMNQCAGMVVRVILGLHPNCKMKIGLPTGFDLLQIPKIESIRYFPSAHIVEGSGRLGISIGFIDLLSRPLFDLSKYSASGPEEDIEFL